jgi:hypothetical protein
VVGRNNRLKLLCNSDVMKLSHSWFNYAGSSGEAGRDLLVCRKTWMPATTGAPPRNAVPLRAHGVAQSGSMISKAAVRQSSAAQPPISFPSTSLGGQRL